MDPKEAQKRQKAASLAQRGMSHFSEPLDLGGTPDVNLQNLTTLNMSYSPSGFTTLASKMSSSELVENAGTSHRDESQPVRQPVASASMMHSIAAVRDSKENIMQPMSDGPRFQASIGGETMGKSSVGFDKSIKLSQNDAAA